MVPEQEGGEASDTRRAAAAARVPRAVPSPPARGGRRRQPAQHDPRHAGPHPRHGGGGQRHGQPQLPAPRFAPPLSPEDRAHLRRKPLPLRLPSPPRRNSFPCPRADPRRCRALSPGAGPLQPPSAADSAALAPFAEDIEIDEVLSARPRRAPTGRDMLINVVEGEEVRIAVSRRPGRPWLLEELYMERSSTESHIGNIYKGRVTNVEPSIQAAFIDFGIGKNGFLHISDLHPQYFPKRHQPRMQFHQPRRTPPPGQRWPQPAPRPAAESAAAAPQEPPQSPLTPEGGEIMSTEQPQPASTGLAHEVAADAPMMSARMAFQNP